MKKLVALIAVLIFSNCEVKFKEVNAQASSFSRTYTKDVVVIDGMQYLFVYVPQQSSQTGYAISVVNLTKDKLEIELLKKQLEQLK